MLILKKSCKALITALCTLFIYSCSSNDKLDINNYQLQSIQWKLSADDACIDKECPRGEIGHKFRACLDVFVEEYSVHK